MANKPSAPAMRAAVTIINSTVNPAMRHDAVNVTAPHLARIIEEQTSVADLLKATKTLIEKSDAIISAIEGVTDQFEPEVAALTKATSDAEKVLKYIMETGHGKRGKRSSQLIHTPGPVRVSALSRPEIVTDRSTAYETQDVVTQFAQPNADVNARLVSAAYNAFDSAAKKLGVNAVELAERMQEGEIAGLVSAIEQPMWQVVNGTPAEKGNVGMEARAILTKVKENAA